MWTCTCMTHRHTRELCTNTSAVAACTSITCFLLCRSGVMVRDWTCDSKGRRFETQPFHFQVQPWASCLHTCTCHPAADWYHSRGSDVLWLGRYTRSGITRTKHHRFQWSIKLQTQGREISTLPTPTPHGVWHNLSFSLCRSKHTHTHTWTQVAAIMLAVMWKYEQNVATKNWHDSEQVNSGQQVLTTQYNVAV